MRHVRDPVACAIIWIVDLIDPCVNIDHARRSSETFSVISQHRQSHALAPTGGFISIFLARIRKDRDVCLA